MRLRAALRDYRRHEGHETRFPGERRTMTGLFTGDASRLVHVSPDGSLRDFGYPLSQVSGLSRCRLGIERDGKVTWFVDGEQSYHEDTTLVVTDHEVDSHRVRQYDRTVDGVHLTHVGWADAPADAQLVAVAAFEPGGREGRVGQLRHGDAVELYHAREHDFLASATGFDAVEGRPSRLGDVLAGREPAETAAGRYEENRLTGLVAVSVPFEDGTATLGTHLTTSADRDAALERIRTAVGRASTARFRDAPAVPSAEHEDVADVVEACVTADLRVLSLLSAPTGLRMAGPEFDSFYAHSGGYGYTWFRDDSEIARFLLHAGRRLDVGLDAWHAQSARRYVETQRDDGTWPHRVWPADGSLAPGWANARLEAGDDVAYQADQTGSVAAFLADYLPDAPADLREPLVETLTAAVDGLDDSLAADGRPVVCQNAWENMDGRFTHTAAAFLHGYSAAVTAAALPDAVRDHARAQATCVYDALDDLWVGDHYALRERPDGSVDDRVDSATFAFAGAHRSYHAAVGVDDRRLNRLIEHVDTAVDALRRETDAVTGLIRFEGDDWRCREQAGEKVWTVSTGWAASACVELAELLETVEDPRAEALTVRSRALLDLMLPGGPLSTAGGYLPEQFFDDGTPDSVRPLGWPHAIRLATVAALVDRDALG
jgi:hypothetical protein